MLVSSEYTLNCQFKWNLMFDVFELLGRSVCFSLSVPAAIASEAEWSWFQ